MCIHEMQMANRCTRRVIDVTADGNGNALLPDASRMLWIAGVVSGGAMNLYTRPGGLIAHVLPKDTEMAEPGGVLSYCHRRHCGSSFLGPVYGFATPGAAVSFIVMEMDHQTYTQTLNLEG